MYEQRKCELFKLENNKCIEAKYIDKLFGYKKSIKEINNEWGWLALYQKYISAIKAYSYDNVDKSCFFSHKTKRITTYKFC